MATLAIILVNCSSVTSEDLQNDNHIFQPGEQCGVLLALQWREATA
jgi:hypothetical protein